MTITTSDADELREKLRKALTKEWLLTSNIWCNNASGTKKETVKFPAQPFKVTPSEKVLDGVVTIFQDALHSQAKAILAAAPKDYVPAGHEPEACLNHERYTSACCGCQRQTARLQAIDDYTATIKRIGGLE